MRNCEHTLGAEIGVQVVAEAFRPRLGGRPVPRAGPDQVLLAIEGPIRVAAW